MAPTSIEGGTQGDFEFPESSQRIDAILQLPVMKDFLRSAFAPGKLKVQESGQNPVHPEEQQQILTATRLLLTEMCLQRIPINEPEYVEIDPRTTTIGDLTNLTRQGKLNPADIGRLIMPNQTQTPHITQLLRPEIFRTEEGQAELRKHTTDKAINKALQWQFGNRIWVKIVQKALSENRAPHAVHPLKALHGYNGLVVGLPTVQRYNPYSRLFEEIGEDPEPTRENELSIASKERSRDEIITLMLYEAENGLATQDDTEEIYKLLTESPLFQRAFSKAFNSGRFQGGPFPIFERLPITLELIEKLDLSDEGIIVILLNKVKNNLLDDRTVKTMEWILDNPERYEATELRAFLLDSETLARTSLNPAIRRFRERLRPEIDRILQLPAFKELEGDPPTPEEDAEIAAELRARLKARAEETVRRGLEEWMTTVNNGEDDENED